MKRKFLSLVLAFVLILPTFMFLSSCGGKDTKYNAKIELKTNASLGQAIRFDRYQGEEDMNKVLEYYNLNSGDEVSFDVYIDKGYDHSDLEVSANGTALSGEVKEVEGDGENDQNILRDRVITYKVQVNDNINVTVDATKCKLASYSIKLVNAPANSYYAVAKDVEFADGIPNSIVDNQSYKIEGTNPIEVPFGKNLYIWSQTKLDSFEVAVNDQFNTVLSYGGVSKKGYYDYKYNDLYYVYYLDLSSCDDLNLFARAKEINYIEEDHNFVEHYLGAYNVVTTFNYRGCFGAYPEPGYAKRKSSPDIGYMEGEFTVNGVTEKYTTGVVTGTIHNRGGRGLVYLGGDLDADIENGIISESDYHEASNKLYYRIIMLEDSGLSIDYFEATLISMDIPNKQVDLDFIQTDDGTYFIVIDKSTVSSLIVNETVEGEEYQTGTGLLCINIKEEKKNEFIKLNITSNLFSDSMYYCGDYDFRFDNKIALMCMNWETKQFETYILKSSFLDNTKPVLKLTIELEHKHNLKERFSHALLNVKGKNGATLSQGENIRIDSYDFGDDRQGIVVLLSERNYGMVTPLQDEYTLDFQFIYKDSFEGTGSYNDKKLDLSDLQIPENLELYYTDDYKKPISEWKKLDSSSNIIVSERVPLYFVVRPINENLEFNYRGIEICVKIGEEYINISAYGALLDIRGITNYYNSYGYVEYVELLSNNIDFSSIDGNLYLKFFALD